MRDIEGLQGCNGVFPEEDEEHSSKRNSAQKGTGGLRGIALVGKYKYPGSDNPQRV